MTTLNMLRFSVFVFTAQHLKVQKACKRPADTICEAQEGFYCIKLNKDSCAFAVEHSACKPGQYIKQRGECMYLYIIQSQYFYRNRI